MFKFKKIKINGNLKEDKDNKSFKDNNTIFKDIPGTGELITRKDQKFNIPLDGCLPQKWTRNRE